MGFEIARPVATVRVYFLVDRDVDGRWFWKLKQGENTVCISAATFDSGAEAEVDARHARRIALHAEVDAVIS